MQRAFLLSERLLGAACRPHSPLLSPLVPCSTLSQSRAGQSTVVQPKLRAQQKKMASQIAGIPLQHWDELSNIPATKIPALELDVSNPFSWSTSAALMKGCEVGKQLRVAVLLSGGVDSSLALHLLVAAGHACTAFYLKIWFQEDFRNFWDACPWEEDLEYARKVCDTLGVELVVVPMTDDYWAKVVEESVQEIKAGRTPNPDILCNSRVKFGAFYEYLDSSFPEQFDRVASGHYARLIRQSNTHLHHHNLDRDAVPPGDEDLQASLTNVRCAETEDRSFLPTQSCASTSSRSCEDMDVQLAMTPDAIKDQTYFLAHLTQQQLRRALFPIGNLTKAQVRALAAAAGLATKNRKDSQGICFLGKVKFNEFVKEHLGEWPGPIVEVESGKVLGAHPGYWFFTVGQRGGIRLSGGPWYVVKKDVPMNVVYVSKNYYDDMKPRNQFTCGPFNWIGAPPLDSSGLMCKVRHGPHMYSCTLSVEAGRTHGQVTLEGNDQGLAAGQFAVFYHEGVCLGAAKILDWGQ